MKITFKDICWFAVVALIMVYLSKCHRDKTGELNTEITDILTKHAQDSIVHLQGMIDMEARIIEERRKTDSAVAQVEASTSNLNAAQSTVSRLSKALRIARQFSVDTSFITVAPEYVDYCDSLAVESDYLTKEISRYQDVAAAVVIAKDREIDLRDDIIARERAFAQECRSQFADLQTTYKKATALIRPSNQVYIGAEIIGTQLTFFQNIGAALTLKTKRNKLWQISSGIQSNGQLYGRLSGSILITFKR